jgi:hypothetical protein
MVSRYRDKETERMTETEKKKQAACIIESFGVPKLAIRRGRDFRALEAELDRFTAYGYGRASQRRFLHAPDPGLGMSPAQALVERGGTSRVLKVVRRRLAALESSA